MLKIISCLFAASLIGLSGCGKSAKSNTANFEAGKTSNTPNSTINFTSSDSTWSGWRNYYKNALDLTGDALFKALHEAAARNQKPMSYSAVWEALKYTDEDPANPDNVILLYTGRSQAKSYNASPDNGDGNAWNREHVWPKSHGFPDSEDWAHNDIHHIRPADVSVNSARSDKDFDIGGSAEGEARDTFTDNDSFEPRDRIKGDIARMLFYMDVRYNGGESTGTDDLVLVNFTNTSGGYLGKLCVLLAWHKQDPVSTEEVNRHAKIVEKQGNRNPFVDHPKWVDDLWSGVCP